MLQKGAGDVAEIEVKAAATVTAEDFRGLRKLAAAAEEKFRAGVVLYDGEASVSFGDRMYAVPVRALWETECRGQAPPQPAGASPFPHNLHPFSLPT